MNPTSGSAITLYVALIAASATLGGIFLKPWADQYWQRHFLRRRLYKEIAFNYAMLMGYHKAQLPHPGKDEYFKGLLTGIRFDRFNYAQMREATTFHELKESQAIETLYRQLHYLVDIKLPMTPPATLRNGLCGTLMSFQLPLSSKTIDPKRVLGNK